MPVCGCFYTLGGAPQPPLRTKHLKAGVTVRAREKTKVPTALLGCTALSLLPLCILAASLECPPPLSCLSMFVREQRSQVNPYGSGVCVCSKYGHLSL